jgi:adenylate kinase
MERGLVAKGKIVVMLGAPGAGKGTQARMLQERYTWPQISTGDILRTMAKSDTALGQQIRDIQADGKLVSDEILADVVRMRTSENDCANGYILDGYPRTLVQANQLELLADEQQHTIIVINVSVDDEILMKRLTGRRTCIGCGEIYNIYFKPPKRKDFCDLCGKDLMQRADDQPEPIGRRLQVYHQLTSPLIYYYQQSERLFSIDGSQDLDTVFSQLCHIIAV